MRRYEGYKDSGIEWIGEIPRQWRIEKIKWIFEERNERNRNLAYGEKDLLSVSEYYGVAKKAERIKEDEILNRAESLDGNKIVLKNDLVINIMLAWKKGLGVSVYNGIVSGSYCVYRLKDENCNPKFFHYLFRTDLYAEIFRQNSTGIIDSRLRLYTEEFFSLAVAIPRKQEQENIVAFLDTKVHLIEKAVSQKQKLIKLLNDEKAAIINHAVTKGLDDSVPMKPSGIDWLGDIPNHWKVKKLKFLISSIQGGGTPSTDNAAFWNGSIPWVSPKDMKVEKELIETVDYVTDSAIQNSSTILIPKGRIIIVVRSGILKHTVPVAINTVPVTLNQDMKAIEPNQLILPEFLFWLLKGCSNSILTFCNKLGATVDSLEIENLRCFPVPYSDIQEQREIVSYLNETTERIKKTVARIEAEIQLLKEYKTSLIYEVVTGKVRIDKLFEEPMEAIEA